MDKNSIVSIQPQAVKIIEKIKQNRLINGIKDSKARIISEAISLLANKENINES